jgi:hypothetical protein
VQETIESAKNMTCEERSTMYILLRIGMSSYHVPLTNSKEEALTRHNIKDLLSKFLSLQEANACTKDLKMYVWSVLTG